MLIGQLAKLTGTRERLLRYYERVGLLTSSRHANGYRDYDDDAEQTVRQIRALLAAGLSTNLIRQVLALRPRGRLAASVPRGAGQAPCPARPPRPARGRVGASSADSATSDRDH